MASISNKTQDSLLSSVEERLEGRILQLEARVLALELALQQLSRPDPEEHRGSDDDDEYNDLEDDVSSLGEGDDGMGAGLDAMKWPVTPGDMAMARADVYSDGESEDGEDEDVEEDDGKMLLALAKKGQHLNVKDLLERKPGLIRTKSSEGETVLHVAASHGHVDTVKQLVRIISKKKDNTAVEEENEISSHHRGLIRAKTWSGDTALHVAARSGHVDTVKHLVRVISNKEKDVLGRGGETVVGEEQGRGHGRARGVERGG